VLVYDENNTPLSKFTSSMLFSKNSVLSITLLHANTYVIAYSLSFIMEHICKLDNNRQEHALPVYFRPVFVASNKHRTRC